MKALPKLVTFLGCGLCSAVALAQGYYSAAPYGAPASLNAPSALVPPAVSVPATVPQPVGVSGSVAADPAPKPPASADAPLLSQPGAEGPWGCVGPQAPPCNRWWFQVGGLVMARDYNEEVWLTYDALDPTRGLLSTADVEANYQGGIEATFGHRVGCNWWALATYWTLEPMNEVALLQSPAGLLSTALDFRSLTLGGWPVNDWFDNAQAHKANLRSEFHNVEINLVHDRWAISPCHPVYFSYLVGARWFKFDEDFLYASADTSTTFGTDPANEAYLDIDVSNNLIGAQVGCLLEYYPLRRLSVFVAPRVGIYSNHITLKYRIYSGDGLSALDIRSNKGDFATLAQLDVGAAYYWSPSLSLYIGYRLVAASGVALTTDQMPRLLDDLAAITQVDDNGHVFLHGGFAGLIWTF